MPVIVSRPWTRQPPFAAGLNPSLPAATFLFNAATGAAINLANGNPFTVNGTQTFKASPAGQGAYPGSTTSGMYVDAAGASSVPFTIVIQHVAGTPSANLGFAQWAGTSASDGAPWLYYRITRLIFASGGVVHTKVLLAQQG